MSLRNRILAIVLVPLLLITTLLMLLTLTQQQKRYTSLLERSGAQAASTFGGGIQDVMDSSGQALSSNEIVENTHMRLLELVNLGATPLNFAAVYDRKGALLSAQDKQSSESSVASAQARQSFLKNLGDQSEALSAYARTTAEFKPTAQAIPSSIRESFAGKPTTVIGYPLPGGSGTVVLGLDSGYIRQQVMGNILPVILTLLALAGLLTAVAAHFANQLIRRITNLSARVDAISMGEIEKPIVPDGKDELGTLAAAVERMRVSLDTVMQRL